MSNTQEIAPIQPAPVPAPRPEPLREERIFALQQRQANALASSSMVPQAYQGNIPNCIIAMEIAERLGASIFAVMQNLDVIHGRPAWRATFLIATVNRCGRFTSLRFRWQGTEGRTDWGCRAVATDRETGEECVGALITIAMANDEGWSKKSGSKWKTMPEQMLMYRAAAFWTRVYAPELSLGMHTSDEVEDSSTVVRAEPSAAQVSDAATRITRSAERNAQRASEPVEVAEPSKSDEQPDGVAYDPETGEVHEYDELPDEYAG